MNPDAGKSIQGTKLLPKEKPIELLERYASLEIGILSDSNPKETRICLTPWAVRLLVERGCDVSIQRGAGMRAGFTDLEYSNAGAKMENDRTEILHKNIILQVSQLNMQDIQKLKTQQTLITHICIRNTPKEYFTALAHKKTTCIGLNIIENSHGCVLLEHQQNEIAGTATVYELLGMIHNKPVAKDMLISHVTGIPSVEAVIVGADTAGITAAGMLSTLGCHVRVYDESLEGLGCAKKAAGGNILTGLTCEPGFVRSLEECGILLFSNLNIEHAFADLSWLAKLRKNCVIAELNTNCSKIIPEDFIFARKYVVQEQFGLKYSLMDCPQRNYAHSASTALSNGLCHCLSQVCDKAGVMNTIRAMRGFDKGTYMLRGIPVREDIARFHDLPWKNIAMVLLSGS